MTFLIRGYHGGAAILSVARTDNATVSMRTKGWRVLDWANQTVHTPLGRYRVDCTRRNDLDDILVDYDVLEVDDRGIAYVVFSGKSNSNALFITGRCNSNCRMCPNSETLRKHSVTHSLPYLCSIVDHIPNDAEYLTITGGEPFLLRDDFFPLMERLNMLLPHTKFLLLSNGRALVSGSYAARFNRQATSAWRVAIPLHAASETLHDDISRSCGSMRQTMQGLKNIAASFAEIEIRIVVSKMNLLELSDLACRITKELPRVTHVNFIGLEMLGSALVNAAQVWVDYRESFSHIRPAIGILMQNGIDTSLYNFPLCAVEPAYWGLCARSISDNKVSYPDECLNCAVKPICGGVFSSTQHFGQFCVRPISEVR